MEEDKRRRRYAWLKNSDNAWLLLFLPALLSFLASLHRFLNTKQVVGVVHRLSLEMDALIPRGAAVELVADGLMWTEGPCWVKDEELGRSYLLFSDTVANKLYKWEEGKGLFTVGKSVYLDRSGCRADAARCARLREPGSNGLAQSGGSGSLVVCEHGERRVTRLHPNGTVVPLATHFRGRRLNSPNDVAVRPGGCLPRSDGGADGDGGGGGGDGSVAGGGSLCEQIYFTDPPYGLNGKEEDPERELPFNGVYRIVGTHRRSGEWRKSGGGRDGDGGNSGVEGGSGFSSSESGQVCGIRGGGRGNGSDDGGSRSEGADDGRGGAGTGDGTDRREDSSSKDVGPDLDLQGPPLTDGVLELLDSSMTRPNGLAFSPDGSRLYVANSDAAHPHWRIFELDAAGAVVSSRVFADARDFWRPSAAAATATSGVSDGGDVDCDGGGSSGGRGGGGGSRDDGNDGVSSSGGSNAVRTAGGGSNQCGGAPAAGGTVGSNGGSSSAGGGSGGGSANSKPIISLDSPDGLKVDEGGRLWATGPGGVLVLSPEGVHLGTVLTGAKAANVAFGDDGYLYIAATGTVQRVRVSVGPA